MQTLISFLRGINLTGHNSIKMSDLSELYVKMGFSDVETFIASGNVIFRDSLKVPVSELSLKIEKAINERFSFNIPVMIRSIPEIKNLFLTNPYLNEENFDPAKMAVIFLHEETTPEHLQKVADIDYPPDRFMIKGKEIYIYCPNGFGRSKIYTNFFENKMKVTGTGRNWKTITTILGIAEKK